MFYNGSWGTVCADYWYRYRYLKIANVICRQLGYPGADRKENRQSFGTGKGKIWMSYVRCTGEESSLQECRHTGWGQTRGCSHSSYVGVVCIPGNR